MALELTTLTMRGNLQQGGWTVQASGYDVGGDIQPYQELLLKVEDNWNQNWDDYYQLLVKCFISQERLTRDWQTGLVSFQAFTSQWHLQNGWLISTWFEQQGGAETGHIRNSLTMSYIVRHILSQHTNILDVATLDIANTGYSFSDITIDDTKVWTFLRDAARDEFRLVYVDRFNTIHYVDHPGLLSPTPSARMRFTTDHYLRVETIEYPQRCGYVRLTAATDAGGEIIASYPAVGPDPEGQQLTWDNVRVNDLGTLQTLAQRIYTWENRRYTVRIFTWLNHYIDLGDVISLDLEDVENGYSWSDKKFLVTGVTHQPDLRRPLWNTRIEAEEIP